MTEQEYGEFRGAQKVLSDLLETAPAYAMRDQQLTFRTAMVATERDLAQGLISPAVAARRLGTSVDNVLSSLRGFADKTPRVLSKAWADGDTMIPTFTKFLSGMYDASADYRLGYHLRNYSQHAGLFPNMQRREWLDDDDRSHSEFQATLNVDFLLKDNEWKAVVRKDLEQLEDRTLQLQDLVDRLTLLVDLTWAAMLVALKSPLGRAAQHLRELDERAPSISGSTTHVVSFHSPLRGVNMHDEYVRMDLVEMLPHRLAECEHLLSQDRG